MTKQEAYEYGKVRGQQAFRDCEVGEGETHEEAAFDAEQNGRQYWNGNPFRSDDEFEEEELFESYEKGVSDGIQSAQQ